MGHPRILIAVASKHGSTDQIAGAIRNQLSRERYDIDVVNPRSRLDVSRYNAVVLGSALYGSRWLPSARKFAEAHHDGLRAVPVWMFSSGISPAPPVGEVSRDVGTIRELTAARDHKLLPGKLDRHALRLPERALLRAVGAMDGDYRDWDLIASWTEEIHQALAYAPTAS